MGSISGLVDVAEIFGDIFGTNKEGVVVREADPAIEPLAEVTMAAAHSEQLRLLGAMTADTERAAREPDAGT